MLVRERIDRTNNQVDESRADVFSANSSTLAHRARSIAEYSARYPDVKVRLAATSRMLDLVEEGYDLAIWYAAAPDPGLIVRRLGDYRMVICTSPEYLVKRGRPEHPSELIKHNCVIFYDAPTLGRGGSEWQFTGPDGEFSLQMSGNLETNSAIAFRAAAHLGQGIIMAPGPLVFDDLRSGALVPILSEFLPKRFSIDAFYLLIPMISPGCTD
jgi:DNA-binding transcriptional LysR family regulator